MLMEGILATVFRILHPLFAHLRKSTQISSKGHKYVLASEERRADNRTRVQLADAKKITLKIIIKDVARNPILETLLTGSPFKIGQAIV